MQYTIFLNLNLLNGQDPQCVKFIRLEGYWSDKKCTLQLPYMCKKSKQLMEDTGTGDLPVEEGCDPGWSAYGRLLICLVFLNI